MIAKIKLCCVKLLDVFVGRYVDRCIDRTQFVLKLENAQEGK